MAGRYFSDAIQFAVVKDNLEKHNGQIRCEMCGKQIFTINECHFDHIIPYAKGGSSTFDNCQILCIECNLKKSDKEIKDVILEEKAKQFLSSKTFSKDRQEPEDTTDTADLQNGNNNTKMTKEKFDEIVGKFIEEKGDIRQIDFLREYNHLPGIGYIAKYYGTLNELKKAFGITDISLNWNRENIRQALVNFVLLNGNITQKDIRKENGLPSINCILNYYPEYKNFTDIKRGLCNIDARGIWTKEEALEAGKAFVISHNGKLVQKDCSPENNMPSLATIYRLFGDLPTYQKAVGATLSKNLFVPIEDVEAAMKGMLDPVFEEKILGHAEVRQIFKASGVGNIAGSYVLDGEFKRGCKVRITREGEQIYEGELASLKRFKDDVKEVKSGFECGLVFEGFDQMQELDIVEAYIMVEVPR